LFDLAVLISIFAAGAAIAAPTLNGAWQHRLARLSANNLHVQGIGLSMYANDHNGQIPTYSWRGPNKGESYVEYMLPNGNIRRAHNDIDAAGIQNQVILQEMTGRIEGPFQISGIVGRIPHRRYLHLNLMAYLGAKASGEIFVDPMDSNLLTWHRDPLNYSLGSTVPYAPGNIVPDGYEDPGFWATQSRRQRWAFASSYHPAVSTWVPQETAGILGPSYESLTDFTGSLDGRFYMGNQMDAVAFPSSKVYLHEEYDRRQGAVPVHFAYDFARPLKLMFDGSVDARASGEANSSYNPMDDTEWVQPYIPLDTFPLPFGGAHDPTELNLRYRWTRGGLSGVDYTP
jgi:hypothetical protein